MLKGKIDQMGWLWIMRGKDYKKQMCPIASYAEGEFGPALCGDWCPLFGEPLKNSYLTSEIFLEICEQRTLGFYEFIDERPKE